MTWMRLTLSFLLATSLMLGCASTPNVGGDAIECPAFPWPSHHILDEIGGLEDAEVDQWIGLITKLAKKLKDIRGK